MAIFKELQSGRGATAWHSWDSWLFSADMEPTQYCPTVSCGLLPRVCSTSMSGCVALIPFIPLPLLAAALCNGVCVKHTHMVQVPGAADMCCVHGVEGAATCQPRREGQIASFSSSNAST